MQHLPTVTAKHSHLAPTHLLHFSPVLCLQNPSLQSREHPAASARSINIGLTETQQRAPQQNGITAPLIYQAQIDLTKYVSVDQGATWEDANTPTGPSLLSTAGFNPLFKYTALNNGTVTLKDVTLTDAVFDLNGGETGTAWNWGDLAPGQLAELVFEAPFTPGQNSGDAMVSATALTPVIDIDNAYYLGV